MRKTTLRLTPRILKASAASWVIAAALAPGLVHAEEATLIEEMVVTATKRSESLLDVPASISAVSAAALERMGVKEVDDLARSVPSLSVAPTFDDAPKVFIMRGIAPTEGSDATVALYLDDTPLTVGAGSPDLKVFDLERIEVVRGPQGTLFGSSAMGGAIRYISPTVGYGGPTGKIKVEVGTVAHGSQNYEVQGAYGAPISDTLAYRASAYYRHDAGYVDIVDEFTGAMVNEDANSVDTYGGRVALGAQLTADIEATFSILYQDRRSHGISSYHTLRGTDTPLVALAPLQAQERVDAEGKDRFILPNLVIKADLGFADLTSSTSYHNQRIRRTNDYSYYFQRNLFGVPSVPGDSMIVASKRNNDVDVYLQEVRLSSKPNDSKLEWLVGGYYKKSRFTFDQTNPSNVETVLGIPAALLLADGGLINLAQTIKTKEAAVFGELAYHVTDALKVTAGLRYSSLEQMVGSDLTFAPATGIGAAAGSGTSRARPLTPKFSVSYDVADNVMVYGTASKGFRQGGPNIGYIPNPTCDAEAAAAGFSSVPNSFGPDNLWNYEAGLKLRTSDRRLQFQGAAYRIDWTDIQQIIGLACGQAFTANVGKAQVNGAEAEINWRPTDALTVDVALGYVDAKLTEDGAGAAIDVTLPQAPKFTASVAAQYDVTLSSTWDGYVRAEVQHIGEADRILALPGIAPSQRDAYQVVNLRAAASTGDYEFSVFADNLTDERPIITEFYNEKAPGFGGAGASRTTLRPRTIGVSASRRF